MIGFEGEFFSFPAPLKPIGRADALVSPLCKPADMLLESLGRNRQAGHVSRILRPDVMIEEHWQSLAEFAVKSLPGSCLPGSSPVFRNTTPNSQNAPTEPLRDRKAAQFVADTKRRDKNAGRIEGQRRQCATNHELQTGHPSHGRHYRVRTVVRMLPGKENIGFAKPLPSLSSTF